MLILISGASIVLLYRFSLFHLVYFFGFFELYLMSAGKALLSFQPFGITPRQTLLFFSRGYQESLLHYQYSLSCFSVTIYISHNSNA